jgi:hypothetical protein
VPRVGAHERTPELVARALGEDQPEREREFHGTQVLATELEVQDRGDPALTHQEVPERVVAMDQLPRETCVQRLGLLSVVP